MDANIAYGWFVYPRPLTLKAITGEGTVKLPPDDKEYIIFLPTLLQPKEGMSGIVFPFPATQSRKGSKRRQSLKIKIVNAWRMVMKEEYATSENLIHKATDWLARCDGRSGRQDRLRFDSASSTLLVLDMQQYFTNPESHAFVPTTRAILQNIERLIGFFREAGRPVVYTRHALRDDEEPGIMSLMWQDVVREGSPESRIMSLLKPRPSETVIRKTRYSAFVGTNLEKILKGSGTKSVVVTGVTTHLCCDTTSRDAFMRDFIVYFTIDGTASWTEDLHISSLLTLSDGVVVPVTTADLCNEWRE